MIPFSRLTAAAFLLALAGAARAETRCADRNRTAPPRARPSHDSLQSSLNDSAVRAFMEAAAVASEALDDEANRQIGASVLADAVERDWERLSCIKDDPIPRSAEELRAVRISANDVLSLYSQLVADGCQRRWGESNGPMCGRAAALAEMVERVRASSETTIVGLFATPSDASSACVDPLFNPTPREHGGHTHCGAAITIEAFLDGAPFSRYSHSSGEASAEAPTAHIRPLGPGPRNHSAASPSAPSSRSLESSVYREQLARMEPDAFRASFARAFGDDTEALTRATEHPEQRLDLLTRHGVDAQRIDRGLQAALTSPPPSAAPTTSSTTAASSQASAAAPAPASPASAGVDGCRAESLASGLAQGALARCRRQASTDELEQAVERARRLLSESQEPGARELVARLPALQQESDADRRRRVLMDWLARAHRLLAASRTGFMAEGRGLASRERADEASADRALRALAGSAGFRSLSADTTAQAVLTEAVRQNLADPAHLSDEQRRLLESLRSDPAARRELERLAQAVGRSAADREALRGYYDRHPEVAEYDAELERYQRAQREYLAAALETRDGRRERVFLGEPGAETAELGSRFGAWGVRMESRDGDWSFRSADGRVRAIERGETGGSAVITIQRLNDRGQAETEIDRNEVVRVQTENPPRHDSYVRRIVQHFDAHGHLTETDVRVPPLPGWAIEASSGPVQSGRWNSHGAPIDVWEQHSDGTRSHLSSSSDHRTIVARDFDEQGVLSGEGESTTAGVGWHARFGDFGSDTRMQMTHMEGQGHSRSVTITNDGTAILRLDGGPGQPPIMAVYANAREYAADPIHALGTLSARQPQALQADLTSLIPLRNEPDQLHAAARELARRLLDASGAGVMGRSTDETAGMLERWVVSRTGGDLRSLSLTVAVPNYNGPVTTSQPQTLFRLSADYNGGRRTIQDGDFEEASVWTNPRNGYTAQGSAFVVNHEIELNWEGRPMQTPELASRDIEYLPDGRQRVHQYSTRVEDSWTGSRTEVSRDTLAEYTPGAPGVQFFTGSQVLDTQERPLQASYLGRVASAMGQIPGIHQLAQGAEYVGSSAYHAAVAAYQDELSHDLIGADAQEYRFASLASRYRSAGLRDLEGRDGFIRELHGDPDTLAVVDMEVRRRRIEEMESAPSGEAETVGNLGTRRYYALANNVVSRPVTDDERLQVLQNAYSGSQALDFSRSHSGAGAAITGALGALDLAGEQATVGLVLTGGTGLLTRGLAWTSRAETALDALQTGTRAENLLTGSDVARMYMHYGMQAGYVTGVASNAENFEQALEHRDRAGALQYAVASSIDLLSAGATHEAARSGRGETRTASAEQTSPPTPTAGGETSGERITIPGASPEQVEHERNEAWQRGYDPAWQARIAEAEANGQLPRVGFEGNQGCSQACVSHQLANLSNGRVSLGEVVDFANFLDMNPLSGGLNVHEREAVIGQLNDDLAARGLPYRYEPMSSAEYLEQLRAGRAPPAAVGVSAGPYLHAVVVRGVVDGHVIIVDSMAPHPEDVPEGVLRHPVYTMEQFERDLRSDFTLYVFREIPTPGVLERAAAGVRNWLRGPQEAAPTMEAAAPAVSAGTADSTPAGGMSDIRYRLSNLWTFWTGLHPDARTMEVDLRAHPELAEPLNAALNEEAARQQAALQSLRNLRSRVDYNGNYSYADFERDGRPLLAESRPRVEVELTSDGSRVRLTTADSRVYDRLERALPPGPGEGRPDSNSYRENALPPAAVSIISAMRERVRLATGQDLPEDVLRDALRNGLTESAVIGSIRDARNRNYRNIAEIRRLLSQGRDLRVDGDLEQSLNGLSVAERVKFVQMVNYYSRARGEDFALSTLVNTRNTMFPENPWPGGTGDYSALRPDYFSTRAGGPRRPGRGEPPQPAASSDPELAASRDRIREATSSQISELTVRNARARGMSEEQIIASYRAGLERRMTAQMIEQFLSRGTDITSLGGSAAVRREITAEQDSFRPVSREAQQEQIDAVTSGLDETQRERYSREVHDRSRGQGESLGFDELVRIRNEMFPDNPFRGMRPPSEPPRAGAAAPPPGGSDAPLDVRPGGPSLRERLSSWWERMRGVTYDSIEFDLQESGPGALDAVNTILAEEARRPLFNRRYDVTVSADGRRFTVRTQDPELFARLESDARLLDRPVDYRPWTAQEDEQSRAQLQSRGFRANASPPASIGLVSAMRARLRVLGRDLPDAVVWEALRNGLSESDLVSSQISTPSSQARPDEIERLLSRGYNARLLEYTRFDQAASGLSTEERDRFIDALRPPAMTWEQLLELRRRMFPDRPHEATQAGPEPRAGASAPPPEPRAGAAARPPANPNQGIGVRPGGEEPSLSQRLSRWWDRVSGRASNQVWQFTSDLQAGTAHIDAINSVLGEEARRPLAERHYDVEIIDDGRRIRITMDNSDLRDRLVADVELLAHPVARSVGQGTEWSPERHERSRAQLESRGFRSSAMPAAAIGLVSAMRERLRAATGKDLPDTVMWEALRHGLKESDLVFSLSTPGVRPEEFHRLLSRGYSTERRSYARFSAAVQGLNEEEVNRYIDALRPPMTFFALWNLRRSMYPDRTPDHMPVGFNDR
jgi:hypothetical protein